ncbi:hypothetical protein MXB_4878 [Myxobolus squamalis]|nr:hypothetical protein MXB_4878 [Myxobolus squamalis]
MMGRENLCRPLSRELRNPTAFLYSSTCLGGRPDLSFVSG